MPTTQSDIRSWLSRREDNHTHMIVATDTFDYSDYPVFVESGESIEEEVKKLQSAPMSQVMEIYNLSLDLDAQLEEKRAWNK